MNTVIVEKQMLVLFIANESIYIYMDYVDELVDDWKTTLYT